MIDRRLCLLYVLFVSSWLSNLAAAQCDTWSSFGDGVHGVGVLALIVYGDQLIAGGDLHNSNGTFPDEIAKWNEKGRVWEQFGTGLNGPIFALGLYDGDLIAGGWFTVAGGQFANYIARWDGKDWHPLGLGVNGPVFDLTVYNGELIASGDFMLAGGIDVDHIARWNGSTWQSLNGPCSCYSSDISALLVYDGELYIADDYEVRHWNGSRWQTLDVIAPFFIEAFALYDGKLIAAGHNTSGPGASAHVYSWNGASWQQLGQGVQGNPDSAHCLSVYNGNLIVGGSFTSADGQPANCIARWDGSTWYPIGEGLTSSNPVLGVNALLVRDDQLIVGGKFEFAGGQPALNVAHWQDCDLCIADITNDRQVNLADLLSVINGWGPCPVVPNPCPADIFPPTFHDGVVNGQDLGTILASWGVCPGCVADISPLEGDGIVNGADLLMLVNAWGPCPPPPPPRCPIDISHDGTVNAADLLMVIYAWGPCP